MFEFYCRAHGLRRNLSSMWKNGIRLRACNCHHREQRHVAKSLHCNDLACADVKGIFFNVVVDISSSATSSLDRYFRNFRHGRGRTDGRTARRRWPRRRRRPSALRLPVGDARGAKIDPASGQTAPSRCSRRRRRGRGGERRILAANASAVRR